MCCASSRHGKAPHLSTVPPNHKIFRERKTGGGERMREWENERKRRIEKEREREREKER